jgi:hypothetical protein
VKRVKNG